MQQPSSPDPVFDAVETLFLIAFTVVGVLVVLGFVAVGWLMVRSARAARRAGLDPFQPVPWRGPGSPPGGPRTAGAAAHRPLEQRLLELDDLRRRSVISDDEHRSARARALGGG